MQFLIFCTVCNGDGLRTCFGTQGRFWFWACTLCASTVRGCQANGRGKRFTKRDHISLQNVEPRNRPLGVLFSSVRGCVGRNAVVWSPTHLERTATGNTGTSGARSSHHAWPVGRCFDWKTIALQPIDRRKGTATVTCTSWSF